MALTLTGLVRLPSLSAFTSLSHFLSLPSCLPELLTHQPVAWTQTLSRGLHWRNPDLDSYPTWSPTVGMKRTFHCFSVAKFCSSLWYFMDCSMPGFPVFHHFLKLPQTHVHCFSDDIQLSHPLSSPSPAFIVFQHQGLLLWVGSLHQVAEVLELQL